MLFIAEYWWVWLLLLIVTILYALYENSKGYGDVIAAMRGTDFASRLGRRSKLLELIWDMKAVIALAVVALPSALLLLLALILHLAKAIKEI